MRVLIASHYTSESMGGEAAIPLRLYEALRRLGVDAWLITHDSNRDEVAAIFADDPDKVRFTPSLPGMHRFFRWGERLPDGPRQVAWGITQLERQVRMVPPIRRLVDELGIDVVHQPIGIAPGVPSPLTDLGAPLVVGPLNGGLAMPPAFRERDTRLERVVQRARQPIGSVVHRLVRGKLQAAAVLVANDRTRDALPRVVRGRAPWMPESAVRIGNWPAKSYGTGGGPVRFVFVGRLVPYKSADLVIRAFARAARSVDARLEVVGDGPMRSELERLADELGVAEAVELTGWLPKEEVSDRLRQSDVFVYPSLREPGGTVVLEAMATGLPAIVADWGGPAEYVADGTGRRISVASSARFVDELVDAMVDLAGDPSRRASMGRAARERVASTYDWDVLASKHLDVYRRAIADYVR